MDILHQDRSRRADRSYFDGQFLMAMPGMVDKNFARTVVFICAHSDDGALGFIVNRPHKMPFQSLLKQLKLPLPQTLPEIPVQTGGPVEPGRGFVLHTDDYRSDATHPVAAHLCLTATVDILRAIGSGSGPAQSVVLLGYSSWAAGQLESEITANGWMTSLAERSLVFDRDLETKYARAFTLLGVDPALLSLEAGRA